MRKVCLAVDDSPVGKDTVSWAARAVLHPGSSNEEVHIVSVLEPAVRSEFVTAAESGHPTEVESECKPDPLQLERACKMLKQYKAELESQGVRSQGVEERSGATLAVLPPRALPDGCPLPRRARR